MSSCLPACRHRTRQKGLRWHSKPSNRHSKLSSKCNKVKSNNVNRVRLNSSVSRLRHRLNHHVKVTKCASKIWNANANANNCIRLQWGLVVDGARGLVVDRARVQAVVRVAALDQVLDQVLDRVADLVELVAALDLVVVVSV